MRSGSRDRTRGPHDGGNGILKISRNREQARFTSPSHTRIFPSKSLSSTHQSPRPQHFRRSDPRETSNLHWHTFFTFTRTLAHESREQVNIPKTRRTYCKGRECHKHTQHKVTQYKAGKVRNRSPSRYSRHRSTPHRRRASHHEPNTNMRFHKIGLPVRPG
jgi:ribosomal protein L44E